VRVVREDPKRRGLLFAGTETGVHVSFDAGGSWRTLQRNLPAVPVTDLVVKNDDVVLATQGRSFWILDDIAPLRQLAPDVAGAGNHLFEPSAAYRFGGPEGRGAVGKNPPCGARFYYLLKEAPKDGEEVKLEILDEKGALVRAFTSKEPKKAEAKGGDEEDDSGKDAPRPIPAKAGLNTFAWDLRTPPASRFEGMILWGGETDGPRAEPGHYQVRLSASSTPLTRPFELRKDPRLATTDEEFAKQFALLKLTGVEEALYQTKNRSSQDPLNFPIRLNHKLAALASTVASADAAPTAQSYEVYRDIAARLDAELARFDRRLSDDVSAFNRLVREKEVPAVRLPQP